MSTQVQYLNGIYRVVDLEHLDDYVISLTFSDGLIRVIDLEPILTGPIFGPLRDLNLFRQIRIDPEFGALEWPNGADIDPNVLHDWQNHVNRIKTLRKEATVLA